MASGEEGLAAFLPRASSPPSVSSRRHALGGCRRGFLEPPVEEGAIKMPSEIIQLACTECKRRNYTTTKNKRNTPGRLEMKKYCKWDRKVTTHREVR